MSKVLVIKTEKNWSEHKTRWFEIQRSSETSISDVKYVCIYNGDGTGGAGDLGGHLLKVKEWVISESKGRAQWFVGIGEYSVQPGHILVSLRLVNEGIIDTAELPKSLERLTSDLKWTDIPVGQRDPSFENLALDLKTAKTSTAKFYGVSPDQVSIRIQG